MCRSGGTVDTEDLKSSGRWLCRFKSGLRYQDRKKSPAGVRAAGAFFGSSVVVLFRLAFFPAILAFPAGKLFPQFGDAPALEKQEALPALQILSEPGVFAGEICPAVFTAQILSGENEAGTGTIVCPFPRAPESHEEKAPLLTPSFCAALSCEPSSS